MAQVSMSAAQQFLIVYWGSGGNIGKYYDCDSELLSKLEKYALRCDTWFDFCDIILNNSVELCFKLNCKMNIVTEFADRVLYDNRPFCPDKSITVIDSLKKGMLDFLKTPVYQAIATVFGTLSVAFFLYKVYGWFNNSNENVSDIPNLIVEGNQSSDQLTNNLSKVKVENKIINE